MFGPSLVNSSSEKGKDRPFNEHFDYLLELGVFHANQSLLYRRDLITTISDQVWIKLKTKRLKSGFANGFPLRTMLREVPFSKKSIVYLRKFKQIGRT